MRIVEYGNGVRSCKICNSFVFVKVVQSLNKSAKCIDNNTSMNYYVDTRQEVKIRKFNLGNSNGSSPGSISSHFPEMTRSDHLIEVTVILLF